jgi:hypothetical protein
MGEEGVSLMSIRSFDDVVRVHGEHEDLLKRIYSLILIYRRQKVLKIPAFKYVRIKKVDKDGIVVELMKIRTTRHTRSEPIIDSMAGPPGPAFGWEPSGEDIVGYEEVYDGDSYGLQITDTITIPHTDVGLADDEELEEVERRYEKPRLEREKEEEKVRLKGEIDKRQGEVDKMQNELDALKTNHK